MSTDEARAAGRRRRLSLAVSLAGGAAMIGIGLARLLRDGSFWLDEASIAINLIQQSVPELFGPYPTGHSFPRLYLVPIALLERTLGYSTMGLRLLPFLAFVLAIVAWQRLMYLRLRDQPGLLVLANVLAFLPATLFAYGAMLKQYSLDVLLALVPFLLADDFFERTLREGRSRRRLIALPALSILSFTYVIPLLGRVLGWYASGLAHGRRTLSAQAAMQLSASVALALGASYAIDLRHTAGSQKLFEFWGKCIPAADWSRTPELLLGFVPGWYGVSPFGARTTLAEPLVWVLGVAFGLGLIEATRRAVLARAVDSPDLARWGSRSLGALACLGGLALASLLVRYPICPGRLTVFALFSVQLLTIEGLHAAFVWPGPGRTSRRSALALTIALAILCLPASWRSARYLVVRDTPENVRPLIPITEEEPDLPVIVAGCSTYQVTTLPEWMDDPRVEYYEERVAEGLTGYPPGDFWVVSAGSRFYCPWYIRSLEVFAEELTQRHTPANTAALYRVRMPPSKPRPPGPEQEPDIRSEQRPEPPSEPR